MLRHYDQTRPSAVSAGGQRELTRLGGPRHRIPHGHVGRWPLPASKRCPHACVSVTSERSGSLGPGRVRPWPAAKRRRAARPAVVARPGVTMGWGSVYRVLLRVYVLCTGPSSNGRTADFGSVNGGSNPPGPIGVSKFCSSLLRQFDPSEAFSAGYAPILFDNSGAAGTFGLSIPESPSTDRCLAINGLLAMRPRVILEKMMRPRAATARRLQALGHAQGTRAEGVKCYQIADEETMEAVVLQPRRLREAAG